MKNIALIIDNEEQIFQQKKKEYNYYKDIKKDRDDFVTEKNVYEKQIAAKYKPENKKYCMFCSHFIILIL